MKTTGRTAYHKANCLWPVRFANRGWVRGSLIQRYDAAVRHLLMTPKGSFIVDPNYGTLFETNRLQMMNEALATVIKADTERVFATYLPDLMLHDIQTNRDQERQLLQVSAIWTLKGGVALVQIGAAKPNTTIVLI